MADYDPTLARARELYLSLYSSAHPQSWLSSALCEGTGTTSPIDRWRNCAPVREAIALLSDALSALGDRAGERASHARQALTVQRDALQSALDIYESLGANLDQPRALEFITRIARVRAAKKESELAVEMAAPDAVNDCTATLERVKADGRALCRELVDLGRSLKFPRNLPDASVFDSARASTLALASRPGKRPSVRDQHAAFEQGAKATAAEAILWIIYEPVESHAILAARWDRHTAQAQAAE